MQIVECPHCFTRVVFSANGICPSCQRSASEKPVLEGMTKILVGAHQSLPPYCGLCGAPAATKVEVTTSRVAPNKGLEVNAGGAIGVVLLITRFLMWLLGRTIRQKVTVSLPVCAVHSHQEPPKPVEVDWENESMTLLVSKIFRRHWESNTSA